MDYYVSAVSAIFLIEAHYMDKKTFLLAASLHLSLNASFSVDEGQPEYDVVVPAFYKVTEVIKILNL